MQIKDLKANKKNPRRISDKKKAALKASVDKFGDLSGFVFNRRSKQLISGHQRSSVLPQDGSIKIDVKHETPTRCLTVAEGHVTIDGERFKYREVDADPKWEAEAMLAANKHGGTWDEAVLKMLVADIPEMDMELAGFDEYELKTMNITLNKIEVETDDESSPFEEEEESDEEYLASHTGPEEEVRKENIDLINRTPVEDAFSTTEEKVETKNNKILVIIECETVELKDKLKEKLRTEEFNLGQYGAKMY